MLAIVGAHSSMRHGESIVSRLLLRSLGPQWSAPYELQAERQRAERLRPRQETQTNNGEVVRMMLRRGSARRAQDLAILAGRG